MAETLLQINLIINRVIWGLLMVVLLFGAGVFFTVKTRFFQIRYARFIWKNTIGSLFHPSGRRKHRSGISPFQAVSTALAGTVGTGNIVGVSTAIVAGGPGAVFWMWVSAFFGTMTKYAEVVLAVRFRQTDKNGFHYGGPMYYIEYGLHKKRLARVFALFGLFACFGVGNITQSNSIANALQSTFYIPPLAAGALIAVVTSFVIIGGIKRISKVTEKLVPFMAAFYVFGGILALLLNAGQLPEAFRSIFTDAFSFRSAGSGIYGYTVSRALRFGFARGIFSNEAGLGSAPIAHAASDAESPVKQGTWGVFEVFVDTMLLCTITALVILTSGLAVSPGPLQGASLTAAAFSQHLGPLGGLFVTVGIVLFALSTLLGWSYYGVECLCYLTGKRTSAGLCFKILYVAVAVIGSLSTVTIVWEISDTLNGLMAIPNLIALLRLRKTVIKLTKKELGNTDFSL